MRNLLNHSLRKFILYAGIILACCIPIYYFAISRLWHVELDEHHIQLTPEAGREDRFLIISAVALLSVLFFVLLSAGLVLVNRRLSQRLWRPFYKSLEQIKAFDLNRQDKIVFEKADITEFDELNQSLRKMIDTNLAVYKQQKEFADNASHELQTPLAIVQSKLELLSQGQTLDEEQYRLIEDALAALSRASRINKNLLLLTKIENSQFAGTEQINVKALVTETLDQLRPFFDNKEQSYTFTAASDLFIQGNASLVEIMLVNLFTNAIRYSPAGSHIALCIVSHQLIVRNPGRGPLKSSELFKRFASVSAENAGIGLGLALVKQIALRHGWEAQYDFAEAQHVFTIRFS